MKIIGKIKSIKSCDCLYFLILLFC